jgi:hypothetical protein
LRVATDPAARTDRAAVDPAPMETDFRLAFETRLSLKRRETTVR